MVSDNERLSSSDVLLLIAPGFEEGPVTYLIKKMRQAGLGILLTGISPSLIRSQHGMVIRPDAFLRQLPPVMDHQLVIVPGGVHCVSTLLAEPRVHRLIEETIARGGYLAATLTAQQILISASPFPADKGTYVKTQDGRSLREFVSELLDLLVDPTTQRPDGADGGAR